MTQTTTETDAAIARLTELAGLDPTNTHEPWGPIRLALAEITRLRAKLDEATVQFDPKKARDLMLGRKEGGPT